MKWIIRSRRTGSSRNGEGAPIASGSKNFRGTFMTRSDRLYGRYRADRNATRNRCAAASRAGIGLNGRARPRSGDGHVDLRPNDIGCAMLIRAGRDELRRQFASREIGPAFHGDADAGAGQRRAVHMRFAFFDRRSGLGLIEHGAPGAHVGEEIDRPALAPPQSLLEAQAFDNAGPELDGGGAAEAPRPGGGSVADRLQGESRAALAGITGRAEIGDKRADI